MIKIIYEDDDLIAIDKPSGITVNKAETTKGQVTVQEWAEERLQIANGKLQTPIKSGHIEEQDNDFYIRGGIVHRLDKETSGILLIAKNPESFIELQRQFKEREIKKTYIALSHGSVTPLEGEINVPVGRLSWNRKQFGVVAGGREAITKYKVLSGKHYKFCKEYLTLLELYPETGRTHQIRVHLKYIGHPIFADFLYAGRITQRNDRKKLSRVFLHAKQIKFLHPKTKKSMTIESQLPIELDNIITSE